MCTEGHEEAWLGARGFDARGAPVDDAERVQPCEFPLVVFGMALKGGDVPLEAYQARLVTHAHLSVTLPIHGGLLGSL